MGFNMSPALFSRTRRGSGPPAADDVHHAGYDRIPCLQSCVNEAASQSTENRHSGNAESVGGCCDWGLRV